MMMRRRSKKRVMGIAILIALLVPGCALANSSWHWLTDRTPLHVLPFAAALTILIECVAIKRINGIPKTMKVVWVVCAANLASFLLPYWGLLLPGMYSMAETIMFTPIFIVGAGYFVLTLAAEIPIVYNALKNDAVSRKTLIWTVILVNALTTGMVFAAERVISPGAW